MKKIFLCSIFFCNILVFAESPDVYNDSEEFLELSDPARYVSGAYYGIGLGASPIKHKLVARNLDTNITERFSKSATQYDVSLLGGFGTSFYKDYYVGIEFEIMKRMKKNTEYNGDLGLKFSSQFGINMDVRFGYLFPQQGNMIYATLGFARTLGKVVAKTNGRKESEIGFGSYYPTVGLGFEHKIDHNWNVRLDFRYSITSQDTDKRIYGNSKWSCDIKPQRMGVRISVTKNI